MFVSTLGVGGGRVHLTSSRVVGGARTPTGKGFKGKRIGVKRVKKIKLNHVPYRETLDCQIWTPSRI